VILTVSFYSYSTSTCCTYRCLCSHEICICMALRLHRVQYNYFDLLRKYTSLNCTCMVGTIWISWGCVGIGTVIAGMRWGWKQWQWGWG